MDAEEMQPSADCAMPDTRTTVELESERELVRHANGQRPPAS